MHIQLLYFEDCPSHDDALERLKQVLHEEGIDTPVELINVETEAQAHELRFTGSPTILVNGHDIDPPAADAHAALTCRAYRVETGRISPLPSMHMIRTALQRHRG